MARHSDSDSDAEKDKRMSASPARSDRSKSPRSRSRSRSRSPVARSKSPAGTMEWKKKWDRLVDKGYLRESEVDRTTMEKLEAMSDEKACCVLDRMSEANLDKVHSINGFVLGIVRRVQEAGTQEGPGDLQKLPRKVRHRLEDLIAEKRITKDEIDVRMVHSLAELPADLSLEAVDKYANSILDNVRSRTGFLMGIIKRLQQEGRGGSYRGGYLGPPSAAAGFDRAPDRGYGGGYDRGAPPPRGYGGGGYGDYGRSDPYARGGDPYVRGGDRAAYDPYSRPAYDRYDDRGAGSGYGGGGSRYESSRYR